MVSALESKIIHIPAGYANAIQALEANSKLLSFLTLPLSAVSDEDVRYDSDYWEIYE